MVEELNIRTVAIAGAGTMGAGIAQVCARAGYKVILFDILPGTLEKAEHSIVKSLDKSIGSGRLTEEKKIQTLAALTYTSKLEDLKCDLLIEAIVEKTEAKVSLFRSLMEINGSSTIYASNTSSIPITQIAAGVPLPGNVVGIHFFNPAQVMKLVEIIKGTRTDDSVVNRSVGFIRSIGKVPVIASDAPGFIVNRIARLYYVESLKMLEENVADFETIDLIMESSGFKMGPFRLMDLIGVDSNYAVTRSQYELFNHEARFKPNRIQKQKVDAGLHGRKTGEGFYKYE